MQNSLMTTIIEGPIQLMLLAKQQQLPRNYEPFVTNLKVNWK
jgi:hypothetical protein